jgi:uncharacterized protein YcaQ
VADVAAALDRLADVVVGLYAPLPAATLSMLVRRIRYGAPQWTPHMDALLARTRARLPSVTVDGTSWSWPAGENPASRRHADVDDDDTLRLLAPFDPVVWDRARFECLWGWAYRFEAYTPAPKRQRGYYALPMLWRGRVIGWANASVAEGQLRVEQGYVSGRPPRDAAFKGALADEVRSLEVFLGLERAPS